MALRPAHVYLTTTLLEQAPARKLHIPLIAELAKRFNYTDVPLPDDLVKGMPIAGDIPCINATLSKVTPATMDMGDVRDAIRVTNAKALKSLSKSNDLMLKQKMMGFAIRGISERAVIRANTWRGIWQG